MGNPAAVRGKLALVFLAVSVLGAAVTALTLLAGGPEARPAYASPDHLTAAKVAYAEGDLARAETILREALTTRPDCRKAKLLLGRVLLGRGRLEESRATFSSIMKDDKESCEAARGLAEVHEALNQPDLAAVWWQRAASLNSGSAEPHLRLARVLQKKGDLTGALSALQQARAIDPKREDVDAFFQEVLAAQMPPASSIGGPFPGASLAPRLQTPDPRALGPVPQPPDPTRHFPRPGGRNP